ncbi:GIY-YIG nuclease family protein [uncultured Deinococcus sp.]|uniref:GIY-YIG nuclease family protein n=1 Tax=uncultured Deinococcus sp. TaxID=158789 RepID=UPI0026012EC6|nr:GIY-YIG nuclease family protein [uncultured Deinococcus sp.]
MSAVVPTARPGIYRITHRPSGRSLLGVSVNVDAFLNRMRFELQTGTHRHAVLQHDWTADGADAFEFTVLDTLAPGDVTPATLRDDLAGLLLLWQEHLEPSLPCRY